MQTIDLLLTLGHGASAIAVSTDNSGGTILCGYEEERLSLIKSDSRFPIKAIKRCLEVANVKSVNHIYVTHWEPLNILDGMSKKHWDRDLLPPHKCLITHDATTNTTHHDTHMSGALWYAKAQDGLDFSKKSIGIVVDGFGNFGEHISIYNLTGGKPQLIERIFGYGGSMGLMYQYMTAFLGMKQHQDEYKILGYETRLDEVDVNIGLLNNIIKKDVDMYLRKYYNQALFDEKFDALLMLDALPAYQKHLVDRWTDVCEQLGIVADDSYETKIVMSYYVQSVLEGVLLGIIERHKPENLICSGGVFLNVKLNRRLLDVVSDKLCITPLAGDQGNALGLYELVTGGLHWPGHLNWGIRPKSSDFNIESLNLVYNPNVAAELALDTLHDEGLVNIVQGAMEFGPRAMCNTSTIALPYLDIVERINKMNNRNTVMPMAPVMSRSEYTKRMMFTEKIHHSEQHMITALPYKTGWAEDILGAAHEYPSEYTGRPQVLDNNPVMNKILQYYPVLINTSFNYHGVPIAYSMADVVFSHNKQQLATTIYLEE